jgi:hypothetical protein
MNDLYKLRPLLDKYAKMIEVYYLEEPLIENNYNFPDQDFCLFSSSSRETCFHVFRN